MNTKNILYSLVLGLSVILFACGDDPVPEVELEQFMSVYMMGARTIPYTVALKTTNDTTLAYGIIYGGTTNFNQGNIEAVVGPDLSLVDKYNQENFTEYLAMPEGSYEFGSTTAVIKDGNNQSDPLSIKIFPSGKLDPSSEYLFPVTIKSINSDMTVSEDYKTVYYLFTSDAPAVIDKKLWKVTDFSSEWQDSESFRAKNTFDDNINTYWHTDLTGLPQWYSVDMGKKVKISGITFVNRQEQNQISNPKKMVIEVSLDGVSWETALTIDEVPQIYTEQNFTLAEKITARFFKVTVETSWSSPSYTYIAEFGVY